MSGKSLSEQFAEQFNKPRQPQIVPAEDIPLVLWKPEEFERELERYMKESHLAIMKSILEQTIDHCRVAERSMPLAGVREMLDLYKQGGLSPKNFCAILEAVIYPDIPYTLNIQDIDYEESRQTT